MSPKTMRSYALSCAASVGKLLGLVAVREALFGRGDAGDDGVHFPLLVALEEVANVARLPARAAVEQEDLALLRDRADAQRQLVVVWLGVAFDLGNGDLQLERHAGDLHAVALRLQPLLDHFTHGKIERDLPQIVPLGLEVLLPERLLAIANRDVKRQPARHVVFQRDDAAHAVLVEDGLGRVDLHHGEVARLRGAAEADGINGPLARAEEPRHFARRVAFIMLTVAEDDDRAALAVRLPLGRRGLERRAEIRRLAVGIRQPRRQRRIAPAGLPEAVRRAVAERVKLDVVRLRELVEQLLRRAADEERLEPLRARGGVETLQRGANRVGLRTGLRDRFLKRRRELVLPARRDFGEAREVARGALSVVELPHLAPADLGRGIEQFLLQNRGAAIQVAGFLEIVARLGDPRHELGEQQVPVGALGILRDGRAPGNGARIGQGLGRFRQLHLHVALAQQAELLDDAELAADVHRGIGEPHALRAVDKEQQPRELTDDPAMMQHRAGDQDDDHRDRRRAQRRQEIAHPARQRVRLAEIKRPDAGGEQHSRADAHPPREVTGKAKGGRDVVH